MSINKTGSRDILWCINVFDRFSHLRLQEERLRKHFEDKIDLLVFCNNPRTTAFELSFLEDDLFLTRRNAGHHGGCLSSFNSIVDRSESAKAIVWSHADSIFSHYSDAENWIKKVLDNETDLVSLECKEHFCPRTSKIEDWAYNDFFVMNKNSYRKIFPLRDLPIQKNGDIQDPVEVVLGRSFKNSGLRWETVSCRYDWEKHPHHFSGIDGTDHVVTCDDSLEESLKLL